MQANFCSHIHYLISTDFRVEFKVHEDEIHNGPCCPCLMLSFGYVSRGWVAIYKYLSRSHTASERRLHENSLNKQGFDPWGPLIACPLYQQDITMWTCFCRLDYDIRKQSTKHHFWRKFMALVIMSVCVQAETTRDWCFWAAQYSKPTTKGAFLLILGSKNLSTYCKLSKFWGVLGSNLQKLDSLRLGGETKLGKAICRF